MLRKLTLGIALSGLMIGTALADKPQEVARELSFVNVPITQAIATAQKTFIGQTYEVELENNFAGYFWEVKILTDNQRLVKAYVDAKSGELISAEETTVNKGKKQKNRIRYENGTPVTQ